ncbi:Site-specific recombinase, phage integrase family [gamma proteobacterium IMCC1989]|nr:Site-specific recombinase, phage integrase family [gamma proteobacterium IMCC1989]
MASFAVVKRLKADGTPRYTCNVRVKKNGKVLYSEARTFSKAGSAKEWGKKRVGEIENEGINKTADTITLGGLIKKYIDDPHIEIGRTKGNVLRLVSDCEIANRILSEIEAHHLVEHCKHRKEAGAGKATISHDVSYIRSVLKAAKPTWGYDVNDNCIIEAYPVLHSMELVGKANRRTRRPTTKELEKLKAGLKQRQDHQGAKIPFIDILEFSILSCMRIGEVCSILWEDVDEAQKSVTVRNRKDPRKKTGNHMVVPLLGGAWELLQKQPKTDDRIFPFNSRSVSVGFQRVRNELGIEDLRYHDLRREGASLLFEKGYVIDEVAQVTGHRNINTLWQIYTELFPKRLHDKDTH